MENKLLLALDIGTSGCKITLFNISGKLIASYVGKYNTYYPETNFVEQNAEDWWKTVCEGLDYFKDELNIDLNKIVAIGVDGHSWNCLPVDKEGLPLHNSMIWLDRRAQKQVKEIKNIIDEKTLVNLNGNPLDAAYILPKMLWLKENEPEIYNQTYKFMQSNSYLVYKLTGEFSQDYSQVYGFHFFDIKKGKWDENIAAKFDILLDLIPELYEPDQIVGEVSKRAAKETGLTSGTPVVAGGLDAACCTLGAGVIKEGQTQEQGGQAGGMSIVLDEAVIHPKLILGRHVVRNKFLLQGGTVGGGGILNWFNNNLAFYEKEKANEMNKSSYQIMSQEADTINAGSDGLIFLPYMAGERSPIWDINARGVFFGLSYDKGRAHLIRSMMEGVAFSLKHNLKTAEEVNVYANDLNSVGGSANSKIWTQIKSDITNKEINVPSADHATTLGAAILAGIGVGIYNSYQDAVNKTVKIQRKHKPNKENAATYNQYYQIYLNLYKKLKDEFIKLNSIKK
ncbi:MAG: xylulokinase [bacterium]